MTALFPDQVSFAPPPSPFPAGADDDYRRWRDHKLERHRVMGTDLLVEIDDAGRLRPSEKTALAERISACNMALYHCRRPVTPQRVRSLGREFGLDRVDCHPASRRDGVSHITVGAGDSRYVPYTDRPLSWHTDGYYNPPQHAVRAFLLHCLRPAREGGINRLADHELVYVRLRDCDPGLVTALMDPHAFTIPANEIDGRVLRAPCRGPVFQVHSDGHLGMRYTARRHHIEWRDDEGVRAAARAVAEILADEGLGLTWRLEAGQGILCNNVLHARSAFVDDPAEPRLLFRVRYRDPVGIPSGRHRDHAVGQ
jgi:alpha-ketoglutarate-dependent taurine dioxygenase